MNLAQNTTLPSIVKSPISYKMIIPTKVEDKIRILLHSIYNIEWSGVLFYTYEGSMETCDLVITCQDIYPMNIGTSVYTEFSNTPEVVGYMVDNQLLDCCTALIHSHHSMQTFFSNTDISTLQSEGNSMVHFVSLIVNNEGTYNAAITRKTNIKFVGEMLEEFESFEGKNINNKEQAVQEKTVIKYHMLDIEMQKNETTVELLNRIQELKKEKNKVISTYPPKQLELFNESFPVHKKVDDSKILSEEKEDSTVLDIISKLATGNITSLYLNKATLTFDLADMVDTFSSTFPTIKSFSYWADSFIDSILYTSTIEDVKLSDTEVSDLCKEVVLYLSELTQNDYIREYINIFSNYIIPE